MGADDRKQLAIDHVIVAGDSLDRLKDSVTRLGLDPVAGGKHSNGRTHNSLIPFGDGSYIELLSVIDPSMTAPRRNELVHQNAGLCGWAVQCSDIDAVVDRITAAGISVDGPMTMSRETTAGVEITWQMAFLGDGVPGTELPFLIEDMTPRSDRVPSDSISEKTALTGIERIVLGTPTMAETVSRFQAAFGLERPRVDALDDIRIAHFAETPVVVATPLDQSSWLANRLDAFGPLPSACLLGTQRFDHTCSQFGISAEDQGEMFDSRIGWIDTDLLAQDRLGVIEV